MKKHHISFKHAWDGILIGFKTQPNFKVHLTLSVLAIILGLVLHLSPMEWIIILFVIAVGLAVELINTAIEFAVDLLTQEYQLLAKFAKDTSAAAMLIFAVFSVLIAVLIFVPKMV